MQKVRGKCVLILFEKTKRIISNENASYTVKNYSDITWSPCYLCTKTTKQLISNFKCLKNDSSLWFGIIVNFLSIMTSMLKFILNSPNGGQICTNELSLRLNFIETSKQTRSLMLCSTMQWSTRWVLLCIKSHVRAFLKRRLKNEYLLLKYNLRWYFFGSLRIFILIHLCRHFYSFDSLQPLSCNTG